MSDRAFAGSIPLLYERFLVPLLFEGYAGDLTYRLQAIGASSVLEIAAGTGVVTRQLAAALPPDVRIVATDLNPPMIDHARTVGTARPVEWRQADAMQLPFPDGSFDAVVCQFGVMFFPAKTAAFSEVHRVLKPGGTFLFNVWDRIERNAFAETITAALAQQFPADPPRFLARTPHGYFDKDLIAHDLERGGFVAEAFIDTVPGRSPASSPMAPAVAYCQGTPLRGEIEARDASGLAAATEHAARAIARGFGEGPIEGAIQAHVVSVRKGV